MDRRQFVIGAAASAAAIWSARRPRRTHFVPGRHHHQRVSARRRQRSGHAADCHRAGSRAQATGRGRHQGRARGRGRRAGCRQRQAGRLLAALAQQWARELRRGRQAVRPAAEDDPRRLHSLARLAADPVLLLVNEQRLQDAGGLCRRRQETPARSSTVRAASMAQATAGGDAGESGGLPRCGTADRGGGPAITRCSATAQASTRRCCRCSTSIGKCARWRTSAHSDRRLCPTCRRWSSAMTHVLPVGRTVCAQGHAGRDRLDADRRHRQGRRTRSSRRDRQDRPRTELP